MTLAVELTPLEQIRLERAADNDGIGMDECVKRLLDEHLPPLKPGEATLALLAQWDAEDATDDPQEIAAREAEWQEFKRNIDETRAACGMRTLFS